MGKLLSPDSKGDCRGTPASGQRGGVEERHGGTVDVIYLGILFGI